MVARGRGEVPAGGGEGTQRARSDRAGMPGGSGEHQTTLAVAERALPTGADEPARAVNRPRQRRRPDFLRSLRASITCV